MDPLRDDLRIRQGKSWTRSYPVLAADGTAVNPTGYTAKAQVREHFTSATVLYEWSATAGNLTLGAEGITLSVPPATSSAWTWRLGRWDLELTAPSGTVTPLVEGSVIVDPETTR